MLGRHGLFPCEAVLLYGCLLENEAEKLLDSGKDRGNTQRETGHGCEQQHLSLRQKPGGEDIKQLGKSFSRFSLLFAQSHTCDICPCCRNPIDL